MNQRERLDEYRFGPYRVDLRTGLLWKGRAPVALTPKASELLLLLIQYGEAGVTKSELMERLWPDTVVLENNLTVTMCALRKALGESAAQPRYIQTLPRRGYRFVASEIASGAEPAPAHEEASGCAAPARHAPEPKPPELEPPPTSVGRPRPRPSPAVEAGHGRDREAPFVGRDGELAFLQRRLRDALSGAGRLVCVTGEAGMGKTWLAERLLVQVEADLVPPLVARARCLEAFGSGEAYWPFLEVLDTLLGGPERERVQAAVRSFAPTWYVQFPGVVGADDAQALQRETLGATPQRMLREFVDALAAIARTRPIVLVIEDLHWADPSSIDLLRVLCQRSRDHAWFVLGTFRPAEAALHNSPLERLRLELGSRECGELALEPLREAHVAAYLNARFGAAEWPAELPRFLLAKTEGHPLFLTRLVSLLVERGEICESGGVWGLARPLSEMVFSVPSDVRATLQRQLDRLERDECRALAYASVEGEEFSSTVLAALLGEDELTVQERLLPLDRVHGLLQILGEECWPDGHTCVRYRFSHALYQSVLYASLVSARRAQLHQRAAQVLAAHFSTQSSLIAVALARHFELGGDAAQAMRHFVMAGHNAHRLLAHREAHEHFSRALALVARLPEGEQARAAVLVHLARGWVDFDARESDLGYADFEAARRHAEASRALDLECHALFAASVLAYFDVRLNESRQLDGRLLEVARATGNAELEALAHISLGGGHVAEGNIAEALRSNDAAWSLIEPTSAPHLRAMLHFDRGRCQRMMAEYAAALSSFQQSLASYIELSGVMAVSNYQEIGRVHANLGNLTAALDAYRQAAELAHKNGQEFRLGEQPSRVGWIWRELGDLDRAMAHDENAVQRAREQGAALTELSHLIDLGLDYLHREDCARARSAIGAARQLWARGSIRAFPCELNGVLLRLLDAECSLERARGNASLARARAEELLAEASRLAWPKYVARAHLQLGRVERAFGSSKSARRELAAAIEISMARPVPVLCWKVHAELGRLEAAQGHVAAARAAFQAAHATLRGIAEQLAEPELCERFWRSAPVRAVLAGVGLERALPVAGPERTAPVAAFAEARAS